MGQNLQPAPPCLPLPLSHRSLNLDCTILTGLFLNFQYSFVEKQDVFSSYFSFGAEAA